jgi:hypothetical protein
MLAGQAKVCSSSPVSSGMHALNIQVHERLAKAGIERLSKAIKLNPSLRTLKPDLLWSYGRL